MSKPGPLRLIVEEGGVVRALELDQDAVTIGRTNDNAIKITDALSSRQHCKILRTSEGVLVEDMGSRNGTKLNGAPLTERRPLAPGDRIEVGEAKIHFGERLGGGPAPASGDAKKASARRRRDAAKAGPPARAGAALALVVVEGKEPGRRAPLASLPFMCGRKKGCALTLADDEVSGEHCMIVEDGGALHLVDLGSTNGTFVDGKRVAGRAALREGSLIRLGSTLTLRLEPVDSAADRPTMRAKPSGKAQRAKADSAERPAKADGAERPAKTDGAERPTGRARRPAAEPAAERARSARKPAPVEEVHDLDALDDADEGPAAASAPAPARPTRRAGGSPAADARAAAAVVAQEGDVTSIQLGSRLELEAGADTGGGALGAVGIVVAALLVAGALGLAASRTVLGQAPGDPAPAENLLANWSFEARGSAAVLAPGWSLRADRPELVREHVRYGRHALALPVAAGTRPEVCHAELLRVRPGQAYRVGFAAALGAGTGAALRIDWRSDDDPSYKRTSWACLVDPVASARPWRELSGVVVAPPGANEAQLAAVAFSAGGAGRVELDRLRWGEAAEPAPSETLGGPAGVELELDPRGVLSLRRGGRELFLEGGLVLDPADPLTAQPQARIDQPLGRQPDESLLALGALLEPARAARVEFAFTARPAAEGLALRWSVGPEEERERLHLRFVLPRVGDLGPLELDGLAVPTDALPEQGRRYEQVSELAWGRGDDQVSLAFVAPADVTLRPLGGEQATLIVSAAPARAPATGQGEVGFDLLAASQRAREAVRRLLRQAELAEEQRLFADAEAAYRRLLREFPHEDEAAAAARAGLAALSARAERLLDVIRWAHARARTLPAGELLAAARSAAEELEAAFPEAPQLEAARRELAGLEQTLALAGRRAEAQRVRALVERAKELRAAGHLRLARTLYTYVIERYTDEVPGVTEARDRLAALPPEEPK